MALYLRPTGLAEAVQALGARASTLGQRPLVPLAGATDFYPARVGRAIDDDVLDISSLEELRGIRPAGAEGGPGAGGETGWRIGALATWSELLAAPLPSHFDGLRRAANTIGGPQVQNRGTLVGNVCNASPAADGVPNLLCLGAQVELVSIAGSRSVPVDAFVTGNRRTARRADELVTGLFVPGPHGETRSGFLKLGSRHSLVISIAMVAGVLVLDERGRVADARVAVGACSPAALRLPALEERLTGQACVPGLGSLVEPTDLAPLDPIDDVRGSAAYRLQAVEVLLRRLLAELCEDRRA